MSDEKLSSWSERSQLSGAPIHPRSKWRPALAIGAGLAYGLIARLIFASEMMESVMGTPVSWSFMLLMPFVFGSLIAFIGMLYSPSKKLRVWGLGMPTLGLFSGLLAAFFSQLEALFCLIVAFPIFFFATIIGATFMTLLMSRLGQERTRFYASALVFLPYVVAPIEQLFELPEKRLTIVNTIEIAASPEQIWQEIASVSEISHDEIRRSWIYRLGFPKPLAATLDYEGVGGIRTATFERDVSFFEVIETWNPPRSLSFTIEADPAFIPANAFDEHIIIGGRFYDVLDGRYEIEQLGPNHCKLHLISNHRLASNFNRYASWWSTVIMNEIQTTILEVVAKRSEQSLQGE